MPIPPEDKLIIQAGPSKKEQVLERICREIFSGKKKPGETISANGLAKDFGISRTPVREAMEALAERGLIQWVGAAGAVVRTLGDEELFEILRLRYAIDAEGALALASRHNPGHIAVLRGIHEEMTGLAPELKRDEEKKAWDKFYQLDVKFHQTIVRLAGMSRAEAFITNLMDHLRLRTGPISTSNVLAEHKAIIDAVAACKGGITEERAKAVKKAVKDHIQGTALRFSKEVGNGIEEQLKYS